MDSQDKTKETVIEAENKARLIEVPEDSESGKLSEHPDLGDSYEVLCKIGSGGMGEVYKVRCIETGQTLAAKVLKKELMVDEHALKRFETEANTIIDISHENVVNMHRCLRSSDGRPFIVMDFIEGKTLSDIIQEGPIDNTRALEIALQLCDALETIHKLKIVHRDLKPSNIMIDSGGKLKLLDFGIARLQTDVRATQSLTETGDIVGSPAYMSPEQCLGMSLDERSDIYSLGCILYEIFSGQPVFKGQNSIDYVIQHLNESPPYLGSIWTRNLTGIAVMGCLAKSPGERHQSVGEIRELLLNGKKGGFGVTTHELANGGRSFLKVINALGFWYLLYIIFFALTIGPIHIKNELCPFMAHVITFSGLTAIFFTARFLYLKKQIKQEGSGIRKKVISKNWSAFHAISAFAVMLAVTIGPLMDFYIYSIANPGRMPDEMLFVTMIVLFSLLLLSQSLILLKYPDKFNV